MLAEHAADLQMIYPEGDIRWEGSPYQWIQTRPPRQKGAIGEALLARWLDGLNLPVCKSRGSSSDRRVGKARIEIKLSFLWKTGLYRFMQIRDQDYDHLVCLGLSPDLFHCWVIPKAVVLEKWEARDGIEPQHGGSTSTETAWLAVTPDPLVPSWISQWGGDPEAAVRIFRQF